MGFLTSRPSSVLMVVVRVARPLFEVQYSRELQQVKYLLAFWVSTLYLVFSVVVALGMSRS